MEEDNELPKSLRQKERRKKTTTKKYWKLADSERTKSTGRGEN